MPRRPGGGVGEEDGGRQKGAGGDKKAAQGFEQGSSDVGKHLCPPPHTHLLQLATLLPQLLDGGHVLLDAHGIGGLPLGPPLGFSSCQREAKPATLDLKRGGGLRPSNIMNPLISNLAHHPPSLPTPPELVQLLYQDAPQLSFLLLQVSVKLLQLRREGIPSVGHLRRGGGVRSRPRSPK